MGQINGVFIFRGAPTNGAEAKLWHAAGFVSPPEYEDPEPNPVHQEGATLTTGIEYGGDGGYRWISVPDGEYYVSCYYQNHRVWIYASIETIADILITQGDLLIRGATSLERLAKGVDGQVLGIVAGTVTWAVMPEMVANVSDSLQQSNNDQKGTNATTYTKVKEIKVQQYFKGNIRIAFYLSAYAAEDTVYGRIYHNGVPIGTARSVVTGSPTTFSEDLYIVALVNDLIQIYAKTTLGTPSTARVENFRLYYDVGSWLNQDP